MISQQGTCQKVHIRASLPAAVTPAACPGPRAQSSRAPLREGVALGGAVTTNVGCKMVTVDLHTEWQVNRTIYEGSCLNFHGSEANTSLPSVRSTSPLLLKPPSFKNEVSPGIAGVVVRGMELSQLLPREVWDAQGVTSGDHSVRVVRKESVLKVLREDPLVVCLSSEKRHTNTNVTHAAVEEQVSPTWRVYPVPLCK